MTEIGTDDPTIGPSVQNGQVRSDSAIRHIVVPSAEELKDWKIYTNAQYGFELSYPPTYAVIPETALEPDLFALKIGNIGVAPVVVRITRKSGLIFNDVSCQTHFYDATLNVWLSSDRCQQPPYYTKVCPNVMVGSDGIIGYEAQSGDAGHSWRETYFLTDAESAIVFSTGSDQSTTEEMMLNQDRIIGSFHLLDTVKPVLPICNNDDFDYMTLPLTSSPSVGQRIKISAPISVEMSSGMPKDIGVAIYISSDASTITYPLTFGNFEEGRSVTLPPPSNFLHQSLIPQFSGDAYIHFKFYRIENGKRIFLNENDRKVLRISVINDLPSMLELSVNDVIGQTYPKKTER